MKKVYLLPIAAALILVSSCKDDVYDPPVTEEYSSNFLKTFGEIDPNQDWSMAENRSITVNAEPGTTVSVYAYNGEVYKLAARYTDFSGSETISFDGIKGFENCVVSDGVRSVVATAGETVTLAATRATEASDLVTALDDWTTFTWAEVYAFTNKVPEESDNRNASGLTVDFSAIQPSDANVKVFPVFRNSCNYITVGIYTKNSDGEVDQIQWFYDDKTNFDNMQYCVDGEWYNHPVAYYKGDSDGINYSILSYYGERTHIRSKGYEINLEPGTEFGFVIDVTTPNNVHLGTYYSESTFNDNQSAASFFHTSEVDGVVRTFIGFEDWLKTGANGSDFDLNDIVLILDPEPIIIDHKPQEFILACEDLGDTDDFDFNDVVFSVRHTVPDEVAYVTPLAAGGILPVELYFGDQWIGGKEFHEFFGVDSETIVNTYSSVTLSCDETYEITVEKTFTMQNGGDIQKNHLGDFKLKISGTERVLTAPKQGEAPQIICVPSTWAWPKERTNISEAYPNFGAYGRYYMTTDWYSYPDADKVVTR